MTRTRIAAMATVAGIATVGAIGVGVATGGGDTAVTSANSPSSEVSTSTADRLADREKAVSRNDRREARDPVKAAALSPAVGVVTSHSRDISQADPRGLARALLPQFGFAASEFRCLDQLWTKESNWRWNADNPTSSAYGIPQALPGSKMSSSGADWETNPQTQIKWGLGYIKNRYGSPCAAWGHSQRVGWY